MSVLTRLEQWKSTGEISGAQCDVLSALVRNDRFSVFVELNTLLYLGVLSFVAGVGWMVATYSARLGDAAILSSLTLVFCWCLYYCFARALPYSHHRVEHPGLAFDYVLYLGCLVFAIDLGYLDARLHPFQHDWDNSLLLASAVFFALAYRFDNRFVLSLALSSLAGWFGVRVSRFGLVPGGSLRVYALAYGGVVAAAGTSLYFAGIKKHFLEAYLHIAANVLFMALLSGVGSRGRTDSFTCWPCSAWPLLQLSKACGSGVSRSWSTASSSDTPALVSGCSAISARSPQPSRTSSCPERS